jgi:hypothetical protein
MSQQRKGLRGRLHARRLRRAEDELADAEYQLREWGFGMRPSQRRRAQERIDKAERKLAALTGKDPS